RTEPHSTRRAESAPGVGLLCFGSRDPLDRCKIRFKRRLITQAARERHRDLATHVARAVLRRLVEPGIEFGLCVRADGMIVQAHEPACRRSLDRPDVLSTTHGSYTAHLLSIVRNRL